MKKATILYVLAFGCFYLMINGYAGGPAAHSQLECTGAETGLGNPKGCTCHSTSANSGIALTVELDSAGVPVTSYVGGASYSVKVSGVNNTTSSKPRFGFQMGSIKGAVSHVTPVNAGTWTSPFPSSTHYTAPNQFMVVGVVEQSSALLPSSGTGGNGTIYSKTFNWTAPAEGTGTVSIWAALNAVNGNGGADAGDIWNTNHVVITEAALRTDVIEPEQNLMELNIFPCPADENASIEYKLEAAAYVNAELFDLEGKMISTLISERQYSGRHYATINISKLSLKSGIYLIFLKADDKSFTKRIIVE